MTISYSKNIQEFLAEAVKPSGFSKIKNSWYYSGNEAILVVSPQKSQYGEQYYINLGVYFRSLGKKDFPQVSECHVNGRAEALLREDTASNFEHALDFGNSSIGFEERHTIIVQTLRKEIIPLFFQYGTSGGLRNAHAKGQLKQFAVMKLVSDTNFRL